MSYVSVSRPRPRVALVTLDRPERMNSLSFDLVVPLTSALQELGADNAVGVVVLTGAGRAFCSGADLEDAGAPPGIDGLRLAGISVRAMEVLSDLVLLMRSLRQPVIAAVNGPAIGGGFCLAMGADIRYAADSAVFRAAGITNGLTACELGVSYTLPRAVGTSRAFEILLSGRDVDAAEAERIGLVSRTLPDAELVDAALDLAERMNGLSTVGVQLTKQVLWSVQEMPSLSAAINLENRSQLHVRLTTRNFEEAIQARREGREPVFAD